MNREFDIQGSGALTVDTPAVQRRVWKLRDGFVAGTLKATEGLGEYSANGRVLLVGEKPSCICFTAAPPSTIC
jgi:dihydrolipoamide dehydrogenase